VGRLFSRISCLGGVREGMGVQTKSGSAEPGARGFLFGGVQFRLGGVHPPMGGLGESLPIYSQWYVYVLYISTVYPHCS
jgi:hypothetical protein